MFMEAHFYWPPEPASLALFGPDMSGLVPIVATQLSFR